MQPDGDPDPRFAGNQMRMDRINLVCQTIEVNTLLSSSCGSRQGPQNPSGEYDSVWPLGRLIATVKIHYLGTVYPHGADPNISAPVSHDLTVGNQ